MKQPDKILLHREGQSQQQRKLAALDPDFAKVDERTEQDYLAFAKNFAAFVKYYNSSTNTEEGNWQPFFDFDPKALLAAAENKTQLLPPHQALYLGFVKLQQVAQEQLNQLTRRHLDFYYKDVLRFTEKAAIPDKAHILFELKKNMPDLLLPAGTQLKAGKDKTAKARFYELTHDLLVNQAKVESLRTVCTDATQNERVLVAPVSNSADGLGAELEGEEKKWAPFGDNSLPTANIGFALASPLLLLQEGERKITITFTVTGLASQAFDAALNKGMFSAFLTAEKGLSGPYDIAITSQSSQNKLIFTLQLTEDDPAVVPYNAALHGGNFESSQPLIQFFLNQSNATQGYGQWKNAVLQKAKIEVAVTGVTHVGLENDLGMLDPNKPFHPFGTNPGSGSRLHVAYPEAFTKKLNSFKLHINWKDVPATNLKTYYSNYNISGLNDNSWFKANVAIKDGGSWKATETVNLFETGNAQASRTLSFSRNGSNGNLFFLPLYPVYNIPYQLATKTSSWAKAATNVVQLQYPLLQLTLFPVFSLFNTPAEAKKGAVTLELSTSFLHKKFQELYPIRMMALAKAYSTKAIEDATANIPKEPYTPLIQSLTLDYEAYSNEVNFATPDVASFADTEIQLYHLGAFGQMREHAYQKALFLPDTRVFLLPHYTSEGELYIGMRNLTGGQSVSVLFQVADGSADPELPRPELLWQVLADNYWLPLTREHLVSDGTDGFLRSGIIRFIIPRLATTTNTLLPAGLIWLKCAVQENSRGTSLLQDVQANAGLVQFKDQGNDPAHYTKFLPAGTIAKFVEQPATIKSASQPYATFNGMPKETGMAFYNRVSERLRHKQRAVSVWDYERLLLEAFPKIYKVKCINHASPASFQAPGHVLLVLLPDLKNRNAVDPLQPKVDADTLKQVADYLHQDRNRYCSYFVNLHPVNPTYESVQLDFKVVMRPGFEFNFYARKLNEEIIAYLAPWVSGRAEDIRFGGKVYKSVLLNFVEEREYVDYVTDFKMYRHRGSSLSTTDLHYAEASDPRSILVPHATHLIQPV